MIQWIRSALFYVFGGTTVVGICIVLIFMFWAPRSWAAAVCKGYCGFLLWAGGVICGMRVVVEGQENIPDEASVIMIKHTTTLETYGHVSMFPRTSWVV